MSAHRELGVPLVIAHGGVAGAPRRLPRLDPGPSAARDAANALDAVELVVRALENQADLNAGYGATLTAARTVELDGGIIDGSTGRVGGVTGVNVRHPISLARRVMERTPHVLMAGDGAMELAHGMELLADTTPEQHERWTEASANGTLGRYGSSGYVDTVGAVALDERGNLAAGSSTGGVFGKLPGRVGDAPVAGAGLYASPAAAAVGTGVGELFLRTLACRQTVGLIEAGETPQSACETIVARLLAVENVTAALLAIDTGGSVGAAYHGAGWQVEATEGPIAAVAVR